MKVIEPRREYYESYVSAIEEYRRCDVTSYEFIDAPPDALFERFANDKLGKNLPKGYVSATYLWLVDGAEFAGEISIRHRLTEALSRYGGHIGYGIRRSLWGKGLGTELLSGALVYAREELGLDKVLLTCGDGNISSARVIEKNGGVLQDTIVNNIHGAERVTRRYWIALNQNH